MRHTREIINLVARFSERFFAGRDHFTCVYGSYASGDNSDTSDLDLFFAVPDTSVINFTDIRNFVVGLHTDNGLTLDEEVPYENKLVMSYSDLRDAVSLRAFPSFGQEYRVPAIEKTESFLSSDQVRWRLALNALTSPHELVSGNRSVHNSFMDEAEISVIRLARGLIRDGRTGEEALLEALLTGPHGEEGEFFLGYSRERRSVMHHLRKIVAERS